MQNRRFAVNDISFEWGGNPDLGNTLRCWENEISWKIHGSKEWPKSGTFKSVSIKNTNPVSLHLKSSKVEKDGCWAKQLQRKTMTVSLFLAE